MNPRFALQAVKKFGAWKTVKKLFYYDQVKIGRLVGTDRLGNEYYENTDYGHGRHRWVEPNMDRMPYDSSRVQPEWHGWLHHMTDQTPNNPSAKRGKKTTWIIHVENDDE